MLSVSTHARILVLVVAAILAQTAAAQKGGTGGSGSSSGRATAPSRTPTTNDTSMQPLFISGRVAIEGGGSLAEPVAIERVCNGLTRREGYTDFKGHFQLQIGSQNYGFQDASENDPRAVPGSPVRTSGQSGNRTAFNLQGCELRAVLAGYQSSTVALRPTMGDSFQIEVGTIMLKRMGDIKGSAVSVTSIAAPKEAQHAFEKGSKAFAEEKLPEAQKEFEKAVRIYPQYAAAWSRLGDVQHRQKNLEEARKSYEKSLQADPQYVNPIYGLALLAVVEKNWQEVVQRTSQVIALNRFAFPAAGFYNAAANYNMGNVQAAEDSATKFKAADTSHQHPEVCLLLSNILERKQDFAGAAQQIRDYLVLVPNAQDAAQLTDDAKRLEQQSLAKKQ
jgi:tetratricopeptide (TPR) repeat protein